jgi:hypothetical protein
MILISEEGTSRFLPHKLKMALSIKADSFTRCGKTFSCSGLLVLLLLAAILSLTVVAKFR